MRINDINRYYRVIFIILVAVLIAGMTTITSPTVVGLPSATPADRAMEDLTRVYYPSLATVKWRGHFVQPHETLENMFGKDWVWVARMNRVDRRHVYPGMTIKVPKNMADIRGYSPMPKTYAPARNHEKFILVDVAEQWLGAYEYGRLKLSMPAATGKSGTETPLGIFRIDARHLTHTSSLYKTLDEQEQYPMDNALRFHIKDNVSYWIHARDLPGKPASHGCIGLYDEEMQNRVYGVPDHPVLLDSQRLYEWAVGDAEFGEDDGSLDELEGGATVEIRGELPRTAPPV